VAGIIEGAAAPAGRGHEEHEKPGHVEHGHAEHSHECAHAHAHRERAPHAMVDAETLCRERNLRLTPIRRQVLEALHATHKPVSAYELIEQIGPQNGRMLAPITIYRALDFLLEAGFAHRLESRNAFIACPCRHDPGDLVVFMICDRCGGVDEAVSEELRSALGRLSQSHGFNPKAQVIELAGSCSHCQG
jgi:Fur family zinc uptake transcriptional regulator